MVRTALLLVALTVALADGKPELKGSSFNYVSAGTARTLILYGDNLSPKEVRFVKAPLTCRIASLVPTAGPDKSKGSAKLTLEVNAPANAQPSAVDLEIVNPDGAKTTAKIAVVEAAGAEVAVKRLASYADPMVLPAFPCAVVGELRPDQPDVFRFHASPGQALRITLLAGRAGSQLDPQLCIRDARRRPLAFDAGPKNRDREIRFTAPTDGDYFVELTDADAKGGAGFDYRLAVLPAPSSR